MAIEMQNEKSNGWAFISKLGAGGFGEVQLWRNNNGDKIAIKKCTMDLNQLTAKAKKRWHDEIEIMNELSHPNIIATLAIPSELKLKGFHGAHLPMLGMEYCERGDLRRTLNNVENGCGLSEKDCISIMTDITNAVKFLHDAGITHRDLKPENIVLKEMDGKIIYKLIDLGYAKTLGADSMYASRVGTLYYVAPELLIASEKYSCSVDYWSLGILFYEIVTGSRPFVSQKTPPVLFLLKTVMKKSYEHICVTEDEDGKPNYLKDIREPNHMPMCFQNELVKWFRIVLQTDSKKRGKLQLNEKKPELVVFRLLKAVLSLKVVQIFCIPTYQILTYKISDNTTLEMLQSWIKTDTGIEKYNQELFDSDGHIVYHIQQLQRSHSENDIPTLFNKKTVLIPSSPPMNLPSVVQKMLEEPKEPVHRDRRRHCYSAALFFINTEIKLFRLYILALSAKMDFIIARYDTLKTKTTEIMIEIESLLSKINSVSKTEAGCSEADIRQEKIINKLETLSEQARSLTSDCDIFLQNRDGLRKFLKDDWFQDSQKFVHMAQETIESTMSEKNVHLLPMFHVVTKFLQYRDNQLKEILDEAKRIEQMLDKLFTREKYVESATSLTKLYQFESLNSEKNLRDHFQDAHWHDNIHHVDIPTDNPDPLSLPSSTQNVSDNSIASDHVIYENIVIRYMTHDLMTEIHSKYLQMANQSSIED